MQDHKKNKKLIEQDKMPVVDMKWFEGTVDEVAAAVDALTVVVGVAAAVVSAEY